MFACRTCLRHTALTSGRIFQWLPRHSFKAINPVHPGTPPQNGAFEIYPPPRQQQTGTFIPQHLRNCKYVFVRNDAVRKPLTPAYQGPFKVIRHSNKHITIRRGDTTDTVSINRTKPAFLENQHPTESTTPSSESTPMPSRQQTRSGRKVTFPSNLRTGYYF